ncbi:MAG TPA: sugar phosphate isomerase/epimerase [Verrucomicrobiota bacterium]|nr:sugar phosphate isomerase/epimerase [Verrucomicrobiales bacterium]HRI11818.1 sugar phosphate isomerase/epimerase [Verrucomicrobiota bacterium]
MRAVVTSGEENIVIALQLYTVRYALAQDVVGTLRHVRDAGFRAVETAPLPPGLTAKQLGAVLRDFGLSVTAAHGDFPLGEGRAEVLDTVAELGADRLIWHGWPRDPDCDSLDGFRRLAARYAEASRVAGEHNLQFGLHNHWWECEPIDDIYPYQLLHELLPTEVFFELDVYWARTAGLDPVQVLEELGDRVTLLHLKDGPAVHGQPMTALGEGVVDIHSAICAARPDVDLVVELDECATDPMDAARRSLQYLQQNGV